MCVIVDASAIPIGVASDGGCEGDGSGICHKSLKRGGTMSWVTLQVNVFWSVKGVNSILK